MKCALSQETLMIPLQLVCGAIERRQTLPILSNVLFQIQDNHLCLTGTDLEVQVLARLPLEGEIVEGSVTVPARKILEISKSLSPESTLKIVQQDNKLKVQVDRSRFSLSTLPATDFPSLDESAGFIDVQISVEQIQELIQRTQFAMAQQDVRYYLNGMLFDLSADGKLSTVGTDGHRMALSSIQTESTGQNIQAIVPRKGILELSRFLSSVDEVVRLQLNTNHIMAVSDHFTFMSKLVDGKYPDFNKVLPKGGDKQAIVDRETLKASLQRVSILSNEKFRGVRFLLNEGVLKIHSNNPEQEEAEDDVDVDYSGPELEIGLNVNYMLDVLNTLKNDKVRLTFTDANSSLLIEEVDKVIDSLYVIMPMRL